MKKIIDIILITLTVLCVISANTIVTPVFPHKDGEASATEYAGSEKDIIVDGGVNFIKGWIIYQTEDIVFTNINSAKLSLFVKDLKQPGTLNVYRLTAPITKLEGHVLLTDIQYAALPSASIYLGTDYIEKLVHINITSMIDTGIFYGIAIASEDGLKASFDSKEGNFKPMIMLTHNVATSTDKWHKGGGVPVVALGKDGDLYLDTATANIYTKTLGAWAISLNIKGAQGVAGVTGAQGLTGPQGMAGIQGLKGDSGVAGTPGVAGAKGAIGTPGLQGPIGPQGTAGINGKDGLGFRWRGVWHTDSAYIAQDAVYYNGSAFTALVPSTAHAPAGGAYWGYIVQKGLKGNDGAVGATGVKGDKGDPGTAGTNGTPGVKGEKGDPGVAGTNGTPGVKGDKGDPGSVGHSPVSTSTTSLTIANTGNISVTFVANHNAFAIGQRIRIVSTANTANFMEGIISAYTSTTGVASVAVDYSSGTGANIAQWTIVTAGEQFTLSDGSVTTAKIANNAVNSAKIATSAVGSAEVLDNSLTAIDLAPNSVGASEIATNGVASAEVLDNSLTANDLAPNSVGASEIATNAVGSAEVINKSLTTDDISDIYMDGSLTTDLMTRGYADNKYLSRAMYAYNTLTSNILRINVDTTILTLTITPSSNGIVIVNAVATMFLKHITGNAWMRGCISVNSTALSSPFPICHVPKNTISTYMPYSCLRAFPVTKGTKYTFRFILRSHGGENKCYQPFMTLNFTPR